MRQDTSFVPTTSRSRKPRTRGLPAVFALGFVAAALAIACAADPTGPDEAPGGIVRWDGLAFRAEAGVEGVAPKELRAAVTIYNPSLRTRRLEYGDCSLELRAYRDPARVGDPVWTSNRRWNPLGYGYACLLYLATAELAPGESLRAREFTLRIPVYEIVGDGLNGEYPLAEGHYWFTAVLELSDRRTPEIAAGDAFLAAQVDPVPSEREVDGVVYRAETERLPRDSIAFRVSITNIRDEPVKVGSAVGGTCPTRLYGYATALRRDTWYRHRRADWSAEACGPRVFRTLASGESVTVEERIELTDPPDETIHLLTSLSVRQESEEQWLLLSAGKLE